MSDQIGGSVAGHLRPYLPRFIALLILQSSTPPRRTANHPSTTRTHPMAEPRRERLTTGTAAPEEVCQGL